MLEAQRRYDFLVQRATPEVIRSSIEHARELYIPEGSRPDLVAQFDAAAGSLTDHGAMTADARRAWTTLRRRIVDDGVSARLERISEMLVVGATSGGEVSTATFAFPDSSYLIVVDHGLANLTWLVAQLVVVSRRSPLAGIPAPDHPIEVEVAARTLRLTTARIAAGGRAGINPSLFLTADELALAGALVNEMDVFVMGHEAAHILLGHFGAEGAPSGAAGGFGRLLGKSHQEEIAADLLAVTLVFDDMLSAGTGNSQLVELRLAAVRLFLAVLRLYERSVFVVQPTSHPSGSARWRRIVDERVSGWFDDLDLAMLPGTDLVTALAGLDTVPRLADAAIVHKGLGDRLDRKLWSFRDWSAAAALGHYLFPTGVQAIEALRRWSGWPRGTDVDSRIAEIVATVLASDAAREIVRAAATGTEAVSRLDAVPALAGVADTVAPAGTLEDPFPGWAIAGMVVAAVGETIRGRGGSR